MPAREVFLERIVDGQRVVRYSETFATGTGFVDLVEDDHVHFIFGTDEELAGVGLIDTPEAAEEVVETPKSRKNPPTRKKKADA